MVVKNTYGKRRKSNKDTKGFLEVTNDKDGEDDTGESQLFINIIPDTRSPNTPISHKEEIPKRASDRKQNQWKEMVPDIPMSPSPRKKLRTSLYGDLTKTPSPRKNHNLHEDFYAIADSRCSTPQSDASPKLISPVRARQNLSAGTRLTYGDQRSFLQKGAEDFVQRKCYAKNISVDENDTNFESAPVKSVYELREAGNNKRFVDEMDYLHQSLASANPLSIRRSSLMQIAEKLQSTEYCRKLRASGLDLQLLPASIFDEKDPIMLFLTTFALCILTKDEQIQRAWAENERLVDFLIRCLKMDQDIIQTIKKKSTQLSRVNLHAILALVDRVTEERDTNSIVSIQLLAMTSIDCIVRSVNADSKIMISKVCEIYEASVEVLGSTSNELLTVAKKIELAFSLLEGLLSLLLLDNVEDAAAYSVVSLLSTLRENVNGATMEAHLSCLRFIIKGMTISKYQRDFETKVKDVHIFVILSNVMDMNLWSLDGSETIHQDYLILSLGVLISFAHSEQMHAFLKKEDSQLSNFCTLANKIANLPVEKRDATCFGYLGLFVGCILEDLAMRQKIKDALHSCTRNELSSSLESLKTQTEPHQTTKGDGMSGQIDASIFRLNELRPL